MLKNAKKRLLILEKIRQSSEKRGSETNQFPGKSYKLLGIWLDDMMVDEYGLHYQKAAKRPYLRKLKSYGASKEDLKSFCTVLQ
jgi:hypothetical protein